MTQDAPATMPAINLNPAEAAKGRSFTDIYRVKEARYEQASEEYAAKAEGNRPWQLTIEWEGLSFRFANNPDENPIIRKSVNVTDKNGNPINWGDAENPEPTADDSLPIQLSKYFAKLGFVIGTDPHVIDGQVFECERKDLRGGKGARPVNAIVPVALATPPTDPPKIIQSRETGGQAGNPAAATAAPSGPTKEAAYQALAAALNGKKSSEMVQIGLADNVVSAQTEVLSEIAQGAPAIEALKAYGSFAADGTFTAN